MKRPGGMANGTEGCQNFMTLKGRTKKKEGKPYDGLNKVNMEGEDSVKYYCSPTFTESMLKRSKG